MRDISEFKSGQIIGVHLAGISVTRTASLCGVSRATVFRVMSNCRRKRKLSARDVQVLTWIVSKKHETTAGQLTAELNVHLSSLVSTKTIRRELRRVNIHGQAAIAKPLVTRASWKSWVVDNVKHVLFADESSVTLFPTSGRVIVWRSPKEAYHPDCFTSFEYY
uniref:Transposase Tc1-like domain-containing protein n=1 Tax=Cyprinus carpio carpio TaxID=630221 RepID=A0A9J8A706_CYPCA